MYKPDWKCLIASLVVLLAFGCQDIRNPDLDSGEWAIYRLNDRSLTTYQVRNEPLSALTLAALPLITAEDIKVYHWKTHTFECTRRRSELLDSISRSHGTSFGRPFVVTVDRKPMYLGTFWWSYSSLMPSCPFVDITFAGFEQAELTHPRLVKWRMQDLIVESTTHSGMREYCQRSELPPPNNALKLTELSVRSLGW